MKPLTLLVPFALALSLPACVLHIGSDGYGWDDGTVVRAMHGSSSRRATLHGNGVAAEQHREVQGFDRVRVAGAFRVLVVVGEDEALALRGDENLLDSVRTRVRDGELEIRPEESMSPEIPLAVELRVPSLARLTLSGAHEVDVTGLAGGDLRLVATGASRVRAAGHVDRLEVDGSGATRFELEGLDADDVQLDLSGACRADVLVQERLDVETNGSCDVTYRGAGHIGEVQSSGASRLSRGED